MKATILTYSGNYYDYLDPENSHLNIYDVAHALSNICRYSGHCREFYSVAEHSVNVYRLLTDSGCSYEIRKAGLLHDSPESVMLDVVKPLKNLLPDYMALEEKIELDMAKRFIYQYPLHPTVKWADLTMLNIEQKQIMNNNDKWTTLMLIDGLKDFKIECLAPKEARDRFLTTYKELIKEGMNIGN